MSLPDVKKKVAFVYHSEPGLFLVEHMLFHIFAESEFCDLQLYQEHGVGKVLHVVKRYS